MKEAGGSNRFEVCPTSELEPGERKLVTVNGISIGVFNIDGEYYALNNVCPHQLASLCTGPLTGTTTAADAGEFDSWVRDQEIIRCPWHGWEFDVKTGESLFSPHLRTRSFETDVEEMTATIEGEATDENAGEEEAKDRHGTDLAGDEPPVETYAVEVEQEMVVVYI